MMGHRETSMAQRGTSRHEALADAMRQRIAEGVWLPNTRANTEAITDLDIKNLYCQSCCAERGCHDLRQLPDVP